ncbi:MAG: hypothetical protein ABIN97_16745 [Ginsengibacter sp.]
MKFCLNKTCLIFSIICLHTTAFSQKSADGTFLFKTWFYIEHINDDSRYASDFPVKDSSVFSLFINNIILRLDTLSSNGFSNDYVFLAVNLNRQTSVVDSSIMYDMKTKFLKYIVIPAFCNRYVLCVNKINGMSYRIQGFAGNDFLILMKDIKEEFYLKTKSELKTTAFLKDYSASNIDFQCIYKGLQSNQAGSKKYPCLFNCRGSNEIIWVH